MARGEEVKRSFPDRFTGPGGRNRIRGGAEDTGSQHDLGASTKGKKGGDAMAGTYPPDKVRSAGGIVLQYQNRDAGTAPSSSGGPFDPTMITQREQTLANPAIGNDARPGSMEQTDEGNFGDRPGDESQRPAYISEN